MRLAGILSVFLWILPGAPRAGELECLTEVIYHEARSEPVVGRIGVAYVAINRSNQSHTPICSVVHRKQNGQCSFTYYCLPHGEIDKRAWAYSNRIAVALLDKDQKILDPTHGALYYKKVGTRAMWDSGMKDYIVLGKHQFYFNKGEYP